MSGNGWLDGFQMSGHATGGSGKNLGGRFGKIAVLHFFPQRALDQIRTNYAVGIRRRSGVSEISQMASPQLYLLLPDLGMWQQRNGGVPYSTST
jgi:hypothetical protein